MHLNTRSFLRIIIPFGLASLLSCTSREPNYREYSITQCEKDTLIKVEGLLGFKPAKAIYLKIQGNIDDSIHISLTSIGHDMGPFFVALPKGKIDTVLKNEIYEDDYNLVYKHKNAKSGILNCEIISLLASQDTVVIK